MTAELLEKTVGLVTSRDLAELEIIVKTLGIEDWYQVFLEENPSKGLGYHNTLHAQYVALNAFRLYSIDMLQPDGEVKRPTATSLVLAGLFHDYAHSGGHAGDDVNILNACKHVADIGIRLKSCYALVSSVTSMIRSTEYPPTGGEFHSHQRYLQDADFLWTTNAPATPVVMEGLPQEIAVRTGHIFTPQEMVGEQLKFLPTVTMHTVVGRYIWNRCIGDALALQSAFAQAKTQSTVGV